MLNDEMPDQEQTPVVSPGNYSPVTFEMDNALGALFLGILAVIMLIGCRRAENRYYELIHQQEKAVKSNPPTV